jgi:iron complex transport system substrate-binding protein
MKRIHWISPLIALLLTGCSALSGLSPSTRVITLTDSSGHSATLAGLPERIAIAGKATVLIQDVIFLFPEAKQRVVALENRNQSAFSFLPIVDPGLADKAVLEMNVGPEQIAAVQPDLVLLKDYMADSLGEPLEKLSLPTVYLDLETPEAFYQDIAVLGEVFGDPARAQEITDFYQERVSRVQELAAQAAEKPRVLVMEYSDSGGEVAFSVPPVSWLQTSLVEIAGGEPVWRDLEFSGGWAVVNLEQVAAWDPDQIFIIEYSGNGSAVKGDLQNNPVWQNFRAVKEGQLYAYAFDFYSWDQPDSRWILGLQWLATKIQPELTGKIDIIQEVNDFYSVLYGLDQETIDTEVLPRLTGDIP